MAEATIEKFASKLELFAYLSEQMNSTYQQVLAGKRVDRENTYLKTYLFEFDWNHEEIVGKEEEYLAKALSLPQGKGNNDLLRPTVSGSNDKGLFTVNWSGKAATRLYLDTDSDPGRRFWTGYSLSDATEIDLVVDKVANTHAAFDRVWLWPQALQQTQALGEFRGIGLEYDYRRFDLNKKMSESTEYLKLQLFGGEETREIVEFIQNNPRLSRRMVVSKIRMRYFENDPNNFAIEDLKYNGKFTTKGSSFPAHQSLVTSVRQRYSRLIRALEERHVGSGVANGNDKPPIFFELAGDSKIPDLDAFCRIVFSGNQPFRLWGVPEPTSITGNGRRIQAVDLHTGSRLYFEVYSDMICMGLLEGACGNTVARFFTNLQQSFSHEISAQDENGTDIFQLADFEPNDRAVQGASVLQTSLD